VSQQPKKAPPALLLWWEGVDTWKQLAISFPVFAILTFLINIGPFYQPVPRSILYGLFEGAVLSGLLAVVTRSERAKR
jgi:Na+/citrate or Na+/malate symporter